MEAEVTARTGEAAAIFHGLMGSPLLPQRWGGGAPGDFFRDSWAVGLCWVVAQNPKPQTLNPKP